MKIAVVDTMFARINMGGIAVEEIKKNYPDVKLVRATVPGFKDLAVQCQIMLKDNDIALALGMAGGAKIDLKCAHEASMAIQQAKLSTNKHIIEVFVFENEAWNEHELIKIAKNRIQKHAHNADNLILNPQKLIDQAGQEIRQGFEDEGKWAEKRKRRFSFVIGEFEKKITDHMVKIAKKTCEEKGVEIGELIFVPGCFDVPLAVKKLLPNKKNDAVVVLGAVIKGKTAHDELITYVTGNQISNLSLEFDKPVTLGIIGPQATRAQVEDRKEKYAKNAVLAAINLCERLR